MILLQYFTIEIARKIRYTIRRKKKHSNQLLLMDQFYYSIDRFCEEHFLTKSSQIILYILIYVWSIRPTITAILLFDYSISECSNSKRYPYHGDEVKSIGIYDTLFSSHSSAFELIIHFQCQTWRPLIFKVFSFCLVKRNQ